jgi:hypothetical protein
MSSSQKGIPELLLNQKLPGSIRSFGCHTVQRRRHLAYPNILELHHFHFFVKLVLKVKKSVRIIPTLSF